eukprot:90287_1
MTDEFIDFTRIQDAKIKQIDNALAQYCTRLGVTNYRDENGIGFFFNVFKGEKLYEHHLNDDADPNYCAHILYHWQLPIPTHIQIPNVQSKLFTWCFYMLQYCYKYNKPPSDEYIKKILLPKCNGGLRFEVMQHKQSLFDEHDEFALYQDISDENNWTMIKNAKLKQIDDALTQYYRRVGVTTYQDENGIGLFFNKFKDEILYKKQLSDDVDPIYGAHTTFHWQLPIPPHIQLSDDQRELFTFYMLQYCYKYNKPPSDTYLKHILIPKCNGTFSLTA